MIRSICVYGIQVLGAIICFAIFVQLAALQCGIVFIPWRTP